MEVAATLRPHRRRSATRPPAATGRPAALLLALALPALAAAADAPTAAASPGDARVLRVATSGDYAPFSFRKAPAAETAEAGLDGFDIELARRFAADRGYRLELVPFRWPELSSALAAGTFDVAMSGVTVRPERSIAGRLSVPVATTHAVALTWKGSGAATFRDLDHPRRRIAVNAGGHLEKVAREVFRRASVVAIPDNEAVRMALLDRAFDAIVTDNFEEKIWTAGVRDVVRFGPLSDDRKTLLLPADRRELAAELDRWLIARENDGTLEALRRRWFEAAATAGQAPTETARPLAALASAILERQALMPYVYEAKRGAGAPIEDAAQEAVVLERAVRTATEEAAAAGVAPPDADGVRALFAALIAIGKDAQQQLAELDSKRRPRGDAPAAHTTGEAGTAAAQKPVPPSRTRAATRDLASELRPAIARIGEKIAVILVALDAPVRSADAYRALANPLVSASIRPDRLHALADAIERATSKRSPSG